MNTKENQKGISLIVLVITIIVIIILATAVIVTIIDNNPIASAIKAVDDSNIAKYTEQIEQIRSKLLLQSENHELPNLLQMKEALEKEKWVVETEMIMDEGIEKLRIVTKEGYIFYITEDGVEYKGKGEVVDTSALKRDDVLELVAEDTTSKGQYVKITSKAEEYYVIKYKIGEEENSWTEIKSGERVEVPYGKTIYAKLFYGSSSGVEFKLKIGETNPSIVAKSIDTSNIKRKTDNVFANLFDITWTSEGIGEIKYEVTGNMLFNNTSYSNTQIENTKELELGTYNVKCTITSPGGYTTNAQKQVVINQLASTSVTNETESNINANAIYSEYDLAYFRDVVNSTNVANNAKLMENMKMEKVCSASLSWLPIGNSNTSRKYQGIFEGNNKRIDNIYINSSYENQGLFGYIENSTIKNIILGDGNIQGSYNVGGICGNSSNSNISNCNNVNTTIVAKSYVSQTYIWNIVESSHFYSNAGGIVGYGYNSNIDTCSNNAIINGYYSAIGGIVGFDYGDKIRTINNCNNSASFTVTFQDNNSFGVGGIAGENFTQGIMQNCDNTGNITCNEGKYIGGIAGDTNGTIENCNNSGSINAGAIVGGITGFSGLLSKIESCINEGTISASSFENISGHYQGKNDTWKASLVGGISGFNSGKINLCKNKNTIDANTYQEVGGIAGYSCENSSIKKCANYSDIENIEIDCVGGIVGYTNQCTVEECFNVKNITGRNGVGGIIGNMTYTTIKNCYNLGVITSEIAAGGIVGVVCQYESAIGYEYFYNCYNLGNVVGKTYSDNWVGVANYLTWDYMYTTKLLHDTVKDGLWQNSTGTNWEAISGTDDQIKSKMLTNLLQGYGVGKWTRDTTGVKNNGYPYLIDNPI